MTEEEFEKEARNFASVYAHEYAIDNNFDSVYQASKEGYKNGAEPREKRINELEAQIEKMKCWCNCKNYLSCLEEYCRKNISFEKGICYNCKKWELRR